VRQGRLAKLEQVLPAHLHRRLSALHDSTVAIAPAGPPVAASVLATIAAAIRDRQRLRFEYQPDQGPGARRTADPHRLIHTRGRWYEAGDDAELADELRALAARYTRAAGSPQVRPDSTEPTGFC
jgi:predicted DNA-binding transcriptional regulator YafY